MKVILISGKAQHGKDTTASFIKYKLLSDGYRAVIIHYADLLKHICRDYFDWNGKKDKAGRRLLQYIGTDIVRKKNPSMWVDHVVTILKYFYDNWDYVIIPDCRFPNEIDTIKNMGFNSIHLRVIRPNFKSPLSEEQQKHPSETALDDCCPPDYFVPNTSTLQALEGWINDWVEGTLYGW